MDALSRERLFKEILSENKARLRRLCRAYIPDAEEAEDLLQEIFINIWNSLPSFRAEAKPGTWAYRVAINTALSYRRSWLKKWMLFDKNEKKLQASDNQEDKNEKIETENKLEKLYGQITLLKKEERIIITLALDGLSYQEIAEIVGIEANYVGVKLNRIKTKLINNLKEVSYE
jgi:RNA polymerase sigma-70 factor (ECF subfamily)